MSCVLDSVVSTFIIAQTNTLRFWRRRRPTGLQASELVKKS
jgi:hypothetical protein